MKRLYSIKSKDEMDLIFKEKNSVGNSYFGIYTKKHDLSYFKYAISIGRKYGNAVERNLAKRRIRYIVSLYKNQLKHMMFVIVVKPLVRELDYNDMLSQLEKLLNRAKLLEKEDHANA